MKSFLKILSASMLAVVASSCSGFLDINDNPNTYTTANPPTPDAILAQALAATASNYSTGYNSYTSFAADYWGKSGIVNGYAAERTYNYSSSYYQSLWTSTYDNLLDYDNIQQRGPGLNYPYHAAIARIMKVYNYQLLVDEYGNIPYTQSLKGLGNLTPTYDDAATIYRDFIVQLQGAISDINTAAASATIPIAVGAEDIVFGGNMTNWKRFANSLQLRILLRESQTNDATLNAYVRTQMAALQTATDGFIQTDVQVNPGYAQNSGQQNPFYTLYGITAAGQNATSRYYQIPTNYIIQAYLNNTPGTAPNRPLAQRFVANTSDPRIQTLYTQGRFTPVGATAPVTTAVYTGTDPGESNSPLIASTNTTYASRFTAPGILKGLAAPTPIMLLSEHLFNSAEAKTRGLFTGGDTSAKTDFYNGVLASFLYFYRPATTAATTLAASTAAPGYTQYTAYFNATSTAAATTIAGSRMNYDAAPVNGTLGKQNIILFQKYLAMNTVASTEAWDDYRRAAQPKLETSLQAARLGVFPKRLIYPLVEVNTNTANVPKGVDQYAPIFWDVVD